ncbi:MAG TPA: hypothetical protein VEW94_01685, partial [Chloroflexia bacterium]|nr:hypothetical protein [Chloroflexia bacterium]
MALIEVLALSLGPAIAKAILKVWLKDIPIAADVSSSIIDLIKTKTSDVLAQQHGDLEFRRIGIEVATSLQQMFEVEGAHLDEGSRTTVAEAVAETLDQARLDVAALAEYDFEPERLTQHLLIFQPANFNMFSESEGQLYRRVISECSQHIVDIASGFPQFQVHTFAEVLKRENQLLAITRDILEEVKKIQAESQQANPEVAAAQFEEKYRRAVVRRLDELQLFGVDIAHVSRRRHRLSVAYITLSVHDKHLD